MLAVAGRESSKSLNVWGNRQNESWTRGTPTVNSLTKQGYTGHEQLDSHKLVHMQGRVYDPALGRFLSADLFVQSPHSTQSFNRYSYVSNNPLSRIDPTGYEGVVITAYTGVAEGENAYYGSRSTNGSSGSISYGSTTIAPPTPQQQEQIDRNAEACSNGGSAACVAAVDYLNEIDRSPSADMGDALVDTGKASFALATVGVGGTAKTAGGLGAAIKEFFKGKTTISTFSVSSNQLGKKLGKHVEDFGGNPSNAADRKRVTDLIKKSMGSDSIDFQSHCKSTTKPHCKYSSCSTTIRKCCYSRRSSRAPRPRTTYP